MQLQWIELGLAAKQVEGRVDNERMIYCLTWHSNRKIQSILCFPRCLGQERKGRGLVVSCPLTNKRSLTHTTSASATAG